jgi:hypothetical protein
MKSEYQFSGSMVNGKWLDAVMFTIEIMSLP